MKKILALLTCALTGLAAAQINVPSNGKDGDLILEPQQEPYVIDLGASATGAWDSGLNGGGGIYDPKVWAVVYHYRTIHIKTGATVKFKNHPRRAPVIWLASGNVTIDGVVDLSGEDGLVRQGSETVEGPGGFRGGRGQDFVAGFGPGYASGHGTYGTGNDRYGNAAVFPLVGGSGGRADSPYAGGAGGGAMLVASANVIRVSGRIDADGGSGYMNASGAGSGGGVRLVASQITGNGGSVTARGGSDRRGSIGRIRVESVSPVDGIGYDPAPSVFRLVSDPVLFPNSSTPTLAIRRVGDSELVGEPSGNLDTGQDVQFLNPSPNVTVYLEATNVPVDGSWEVIVSRNDRSSGDFVRVKAVLRGGDLGRSFWEAVVTFKNDTVGAISAHARKR